MRLLKLNADCSFSLVLFSKDEIPPYVILSHTWSRRQDEEVTYKDLIDGTGRNRKGFRKLQFCAKQTKADGLHYFWVDTCCIDKSNNHELTTAINSMFRWYQNAARCYVYLTDVSFYSQDSKVRNVDWGSAFRKSRWFTRGWTLQELLAPETVEFYSRDRIHLGEKTSLQRIIYETTGIAIKALQGCHLSEFPMVIYCNGK